MKLKHKRGQASKHNCLLKNRVNETEKGITGRKRGKESEERERKKERCYHPEALFFFGEVGVGRVPSACASGGREGRGPKVLPSSVWSVMLFLL